MSDITLVFPTSPFLLNQQVFPPLGILYLSSYLKMLGHTTQCLDLALGDSPDKAESDVIGISLTTPQRDEAYRLVKKYKEEGRTVIAGGPHATHMPEECLENGFDIVIKGEGELGLAMFFQMRKRGVTPKKVLHSHYLPIYTCPVPDRGAVDIHAYKYEIKGRPATTLMTTRGCPYNCSFCAKLPTKCRVQSATKTYEEIKEVSDKFGFTAFMIFDDIFIMNKKRTRELCDLMKDDDLLFRCFARANLIDDENCELMNRLGVVEVGIGVESGSNEILKKNIKGTSREMNTEAFKTLRKHGIRAKAFLIVGLPGESNDTVKETEDWIQTVRPDDLDISIFQPLPGSKVFDNPKSFNINFHYDGLPMWYKGTPGKYEAALSTEFLDGESIVAWRDRLESLYKNKELLR